MKFKDATMESTIIIERYERNGPAFVSIKNDKELAPSVLASDLLKCHDEFMQMSDQRTGKKFYVVEPNGHMRITDMTVFKI